MLTGRLAAAALLALLPGACAQPGDFGRPAPSAWNALVETTGTLSAAARGEAALLPLTDDEQILRDRAWRFLMPAIPGDVFRDALANLARARVLPPGYAPEPVAAYYDGLMAAPARSQVSLYRRLSEDAGADARLLPVFADAAARVVAADARRLRSLPFASSLEDGAVREAALRVAENRCLIAWVRLEAGARAGRYRYALEHLFAALPGSGGVEAERAIAALTGRSPLLDPLLPPDAAARCGLVAVPVAAAPLEGAPLSVRY
ncbi:hypothetical protein [Methylobacterium symbioticum]|mgnify:CR=1 FL=1|uniref:Uncharacterized protein n=1 Tax=Methylobacterium symbioticum TaxID=2584084 RepID=A0A509EH04_9HYPH|nr:hypothetical protein [Methylobacterium symbioticum]VUD73441.1 hypothetical protein MET9862_04057 [Methylobacterium symbioticum]